VTKRKQKKRASQALSITQERISQPVA
jgi:hypothetical protein